MHHRLRSRLSTFLFLLICISCGDDKVTGIDSLNQLQSKQEIISCSNPPQEHDHATQSASVVGTHIFYNDSHFDSNSSALNDQDEKAIAVTKAHSMKVLLHDGKPYLPGRKQLLNADGSESFLSFRDNFESYTSFVKGITGIIVDIEGLPSDYQVSSQDFEFRAGNSGLPAAWTLQPIPLEYSVRKGMGNYGSDRISISFTDSAIKNMILEVRVVANKNTKLSSSYVHYWGNKVGETGNDHDVESVRANQSISRNSVEKDNPYDFFKEFNEDGSPQRRVNASDTSFIRQRVVTTLDMNDLNLVRKSQSIGINSVDIDNPFDFNRDGRVNATDSAIIREVTGFDYIPD